MASDFLTVSGLVWTRKGEINSGSSVLRHSYIERRATSDRTHEALGFELVGGPRYTEQEYLSLARKHQATYVTQNVSRSAAGPPISSTSLWILDAPCRFPLIPPSTRNTRAPGISVRDALAKRNPLSRRRSNFLRHPVPQELQILCNHKTNHKSLQQYRSQQTAVR